MIPEIEDLLSSPFSLESKEGIRVVKGKIIKPLVLYLTGKSGDDSYTPVLKITPTNIQFWKEVTISSQNDSTTIRKTEYEAHKAWADEAYVEIFNRALAAIEDCTEKSIYDLFGDKITYIES